MAQPILKTDEGAQNRVSELEAVFASGRGRKLILSQGELEGIRAILNSPEPPTEELKAAWAEYERFAAAHPDSNW